MQTSVPCWIYGCGLSVLRIYNLECHDNRLTIQLIAKLIQKLEQIVLTKEKQIVIVLEIYEQLASKLWKIWDEDEIVRLDKFEAT